MSKKCISCGVDLEDDELFCGECGAKQAVEETNAKKTTSKSGDQSDVTSKSKKVAALLAFFLGSLGIHDFYLGFSIRGVIKIVMTFTVLGLVSWIWSIVDFIRILTGSLKNDAKGNPIV